MESWFVSALKPEVVSNALKVALVVGTILALINHGPAMLNGSLNLGAVIQIIATYLVPYCVATNLLISKDVA